MADKPAAELDPPAENVEEKPEEPQHSTADYDKFSQPEKPIRNWTKILTISIIVLLVLGAGAGAYQYLKNHKSTPVKTATTAQTTTPVKIVSNTKTYSSPNLYLSFSYPSNWTIVDTGGGAMTATSPSMKLKDVTGQEVDGKIVMTITASSQKLPGFTTGNAEAAIASKKITYTKPTQTQRADTYISFLSYATTTAVDGLDAIYVTGNNGYTLGQAIPQADLVQVSPIISLTFVDSAGKALTISAKNWSTTSFSAPLETMLKSLAIT